MGFINPNNLPFINGPQPGIILPEIEVTPQGLQENFVVLTPQDLANMAEALAETVLFGGPLIEAQVGLNPQQLSDFLKNLFQMPSDDQQFLAMIASQDQPPATQEAVQDIIKQNPTISLPELQKVLVEKVDQGEIQLTKILQSTQMTYTKDSRQMGELLNMVSQISTQVTASPINSLATTMLMYLPWYPILLNQRFELQYESSDEDGSEEDGESGGVDQGEHLIMLIDTNFLGKFRITASLVHINQIYYHAQHGPDAAPHLENIEQRLRDGMRGQQMMSAIFEFENRPPQWTPEPPPKPKPKTPGIKSTDSVSASAPSSDNAQSVAIRGVGGPPLQLVHGSYLLMRVIFELDNRLGVEHQRAKNTPA